MAALPSPTQVAGNHGAIYEAYYHQVDPNGSGAIQAPDAARFLKKSRLSDVVLSKIWDLADPTGKGYLDRAGLYVALKLVALAQAGREISMNNIHAEAPPPKVGELPKVPSTGRPPARPAAPSPCPSPSPAPAPPSDWSIKPAERDKYSQLFDSLQPNNGLIAGNKVKGVLLESKLPLETLGKIWDLADQDKDGMLDRHEFIVAMHLVYKALEKHAVPTSLPAELRAPRPPGPPARPPSRPPSRPASPHPPPRPAHPPPPSNAALLEGLLDLSSPVSPSAPAPVPAPAPQWVVSAAQKAQFDAQFAAADADRDGFVSGAEIKQAFLDSGLPQPTLAHIWALCDMDGAGKLSREQFALAMWLVQRALRGEPPPPALAADMLPPERRRAAPAAASASASASAAGPASASAPAQAQILEPALSLGPQPTPEMEAIAREVDALARERLALEAELATKQRELAARAGEADSLQSELDTLTATLKQLENQKGEAQKRLNDLSTQVEKLRSQVSSQEAAAAETEAEVAARRAAALTLRSRERALADELAQLDAHADALTAQLRRTVLALSQAKIKIAHLEDHQRQVEEGAAALAGGGPAAERALALQPQFAPDALDRIVRGATPSDALESPGYSAHNGTDALPAGGGGGGGGGGAPADPFAPAHNHTQADFGADAFPPSAADPFAGDSFAPPPAQNDSAWESDPFAVLHAPTRPAPAVGAVGAVGAAGGRASPTPTLPPKRHKTPPPRPAPPKQHNKTQRAPAPMDFADDPFKDYRYEDPFNIADPFADVARPVSVAGFAPAGPFAAGAGPNGAAGPPEGRGGRASAPPLAGDPFATPADPKWAAWPDDNWAADDAWAQPARAAPDAWAQPAQPARAAPDAWAQPADSANANDAANASLAADWKTDTWASKADGWADWDANRNLNETWPAGTLPAKKEKSPKPVKYAKSLVHTIGGIGRARQEKKDKKAKEARAGEPLPTEEQQWAWAAAESRRLQAEAEARRRQEDAELQLALAISRQEK